MKVNCKNFHQNPNSCVRKTERATKTYRENLTTSSGRVPDVHDLKSATGLHNSEIYCLQIRMELECQIIRPGWRPRDVVHICGT